MAFAQENYTEKLGTGPYTIAEAGCFLTSICNLLSNFGKTVDPLTLNTYFINHGDYIADPSDGGKDELAFTSVTGYDSQVVVTAQGTSGWPNSNNAIVKFSYKLNGEETEHFCSVADFTTQSIVDSYDGRTKTPAQYKSVYGEPVAWAEYGGPVAHTVAVAPVSNPTPVQPFTVTDIDPVTMQAKANPTNLWNLDTTTWSGFKAVSSVAPSTKVTVSAIATHELGSKYYMPNPSAAQGYNVVDLENVPATAPPAPATPPDEQAPGVGSSYTVNQPIPGYTDSNDAVNRIDSNSTVPAGTYTVFAAKYNMLNVTRKPGEPGWWINPGDNEAGKGDGDAATEAGFTPITPTEYATNKQPTDVWNFSTNPATVVSQLNGGTPYVAVARAQMPDGTVYFLNNANSSTGVKQQDLSAGATNSPAVPTPGTTVTPSVSGPTSAKLSIEEQLAYKTTTGLYKVLGDAEHAETVVVKDITGQLQDVPVKVGTVIKIVGSFWENGQKYYRTLRSAQLNNWYGIDEKFVAYLGPLHKEFKTVEDKWDEALEDLAHDGMEFEDDIAKKEPVIRDHVVEDLGKARSGLGRLFHRNQKTQGA